MLKEIADAISYGMLGLEGKIAGTVSFFVYDVAKIMILLFVMIAAIGIARSYIPQRKIRKILGSKKEGMGNVAAAFLGALTPFCSCSSIPIFFSFLQAGIPIGITFSFLISSPLINEYLVVLMLGLFGWKITAAYVISGMIIAVTGGMAIGRMNVEKYIVRDVRGARLKEENFGSLRKRAVFGINEALSIIKKLWLWIVIAIAIAAAIHNYVPDKLIQNSVAKAGMLGVPIATFLGVPMYGSCAAIVPIAVVLFEKGMPLGTALALMMAIAALSLPEAIMLRRAMKLRLIGIFFGIVTIGIIITGYLFNMIS